MTGLSLGVAVERFPTRGAFTISRGSRHEICVVTVSLAANGIVGRGECVPYARYGESVESVVDAVEALRPDLANGLDRLSLQATLPAGAARNALDCAFWDLAAKSSGIPVWKLAALEEPGVLATAYTLSLATPDIMREQARKNAGRPILKIKLGSDGDHDRIRAVRAGAPDATLIVDANEGWTTDTYLDLAPGLAEMGVALVEQPLPAGADANLSVVGRVLPVCADESCHDRTTLETLIGRYDAVNIKLDKTGGLTEALATKRAAQEAGLKVMVGCMLGTSLSMAPAFLLAQGADYVDLDGPLLLAADREPAIRYDGSVMFPPPRDLWG